ncbi:hypothetical protein X975_02243, partial [Stegodyphus mimosarum]
MISNTILHSKGSQGPRQVCTVAWKTSKLESGILKA